MKIPLKNLMGLIILISSASFAQLTTVFDYTGEMQTFVVPPGVTELEVDVIGAEGGDIEGTTIGWGGTTDITLDAGNGGRVTGILTVTPGETLNIFVGGQGVDLSGGYNGGGDAASCGGSEVIAAGGGGASDIRQGGTALADRVIVAGGGGGAAGNGASVYKGQSGAGAGGGLTGQNGLIEYGGAACIVATGGSAVSGGIGGDNSCWCGGALSGENGSLGMGGSGVCAPSGLSTCSCSGTGCTSGGGGGGGYYGGGAGICFSGGGGGSSYTDPVLVSDVEHTQGYQEGNGQIIITVLCTPLTVDVSAEEICEGEELTLTATSDLGGSIEWDGGEVPNGEAFIPDGTGEVTFTAASDADGDCGYEATIMINALPEVMGEVDDMDICWGDSVIFTASGTADDYDWSDGIVDGEYYTPTDFGDPGDFGDMEFKVYGVDDETGCMDSASVYIFVAELPEVMATSDEDTYCDGDMITLTGEGADTYEWDMGVEDGVAFTQAIGTETYTVTGTSIDGCEASNAIEITVNPNPEISLTGTDELMGSDGTIDLTVDAGASPYTFDWDNDGTGDFDDDEDLAGLTAGTYTVVVMDANGCAVTDEITINSQVGIDPNATDVLNIYPNPTADQLTIVQNGYFTYQLVSTAGQVVLDGDGTDKDVMDLKALSDGVYLLKVNTGNTIQTLKVIKK